MNQTIETRYNQGYHDARNAFARSLTALWGKGRHPDSVYERAYWDAMTDAENGRPEPVNPWRARHGEPSGYVEREIR